MTYTYIRHIPSPPLDSYIDYFYYIDGAMPYPREKILPTGWLDLEVNLGGAIQIYDARGTKSRCHLYEELVGWGLEHLWHGGMAAAYPVDGHSFQTRWGVPLSEFSALRAAKPDCLGREPLGSFRGRTL